MTEVSAEDKTATFVQNTNFNEPLVGSEPPQLEQITNDLLNMPLYTDDFPRASTSKLPGESSTQVVTSPNIPQQPESNSDKYFTNEHTRDIRPSYPEGYMVRKTSKSAPVSQWGGTTHTSTRSGASGISRTILANRAIRRGRERSGIIRKESPGSLFKCS